MKTPTLFFFSCLLALHAYSQISFESGYFANLSGDTVECLIKNMDWKNNPIDFEYKLSETSEVAIGELQSVKEFGIHNISKYVRAIVKIDRSSDNISKMSKEMNPIFHEEQLFLEVLIEGKATLYLYEEGNLRRYFYKKESGDIEQLVYKSYKISENQVGHNHLYQQQLWNELKCSGISMDKIEELTYKKNSLVAFFVTYNNCSNSSFINYQGKQKRKVFSLTIRPRINSSSLSIRNSSSDLRNTQFGNKSGIGIGIEAEFVLPYNKNKWSLFIEPTYQRFSSETSAQVNNVSGGELITEVAYQSVEIPLGIRHYFFLSQQSKLFLNAAVIVDLSSGSVIEFKRADASTINSLDIVPQNNFTFGAGYKLKDKFGLEIRYQTGRELLSDYSFWSSDYRTLSIILGYSIL
ncbi:MAG: tRNA modification GTPase [Bacteroidota bacterium]